MFNEICINEVLNKKYKYPAINIEPKSGDPLQGNRLKMVSWFRRGTEACPPAPVCVFAVRWKQLVDSISQNVHVKLFSGADSSHIRVLYVLTKSPAVQRVVPGAASHAPESA